MGTSVSSTMSQCNKIGHIHTVITLWIYPLHTSTLLKQRSMLKWPSQTVMKPLHVQHIIIEHHSRCCRDGSMRGEEIAITISITYIQINIYICVTGGTFNRVLSQGLHNN